MKVDYDEFSVRYDDDPCEEAAEWFYGVVIDRLIEKYGEEALEEVMEKLEDE